MPRNPRDTSLGNLPITSSLTADLPSQIWRVLKARVSLFVQPRLTSKEDNLNDVGIRSDRIYYGGRIRRQWRMDSPSCIV